MMFDACSTVLIRALKQPMQDELSEKRQRRFGSGHVRQESALDPDMMRPRVGAKGRVGQWMQCRRVLIDAPVQHA